MGSDLVVGVEPLLRDFSDLIQTVKQVSVQHLLSVRAIESLDELILVGLAGPLARVAID